MSDTSFEGNGRRSTPDIATEELDSLAGYVSDLSDTDARVLALRHTILSWLMACHQVLPRIK